MKKLLVLTILIIFPLNGFACAIPFTIEKRLDDSDTIFTAKLINFTCKDNKRTSEFLVHEVWKGENTKNLYYVEDSNKDCTGEKELKLHQKYLIFAKYKNSNKNEIDFSLYSAGMCGGSYRVSVFWDEWDKKTKYRKAILKWWYDTASEKGMFNEDIFKYWVPSYYELGKPKYKFNN